MKLSQVLKDWPEKKEYPEVMERHDIHSVDAHNTALTSCDREVDREALVKVIYGLKSVFKNPNHFSLKEQERMAFDDAQTIISTMPQWMKKV